LRGLSGGGASSPRNCHRSISMVRHRAVMGVSLGWFSKGFLSSRPNLSIVTST